MELVADLLALWDKAPPKGLEMSVVLLRHCTIFVHPTPYELHLSKAHLAHCKKDLHGFAATCTGKTPILQSISP